MSPTQIEVLLRYYHCNEDYELRKQTRLIKELGALHLLDPVNGEDLQYKLSYRGRVYIEALLKMPLPIKQWAMPEQK